MISVVIPTRDPNLSALISLLSRLEDERVEVILVVDGGDVDTVIEATRGRAARVVVTEGIGAGPARNLGVSHASCEWIAFLDDDDEPRDGWVEFHSQCPAGVAIRCTGAVKVRSGGESELLQSRPLGPLYGGASGLFLAGTFSMLRSLFLEVDGFDHRYRYGEINELAMRACRRSAEQGMRIESERQPLVQINVKNERRHKPTDVYRSAVQTLEDNRAHFESFPKEAAGLLRVAGLHAARCGRPLIAAHHLTRALARDSQKGRDALRLVRYTALAVLVGVRPGRSRCDRLGVSE